MEELIFHCHRRVGRLLSSPPSPTLYKVPIRTPSLHWFHFAPKLHLFVLYSCHNRAPTRRRLVRRRQPISGAPSAHDTPLEHHAVALSILLCPRRGAVPCSAGTPLLQRALCCRQGLSTVNRSGFRAIVPAPGSQPFQSEKKSIHFL
jgi:hypothetical protein